MHRCPSRAAAELGEASLTSHETIARSEIHAGELLGQDTRTGATRMPIYDYTCGTCAHEFEAFLRKQTDDVACPACQSGDVKRMLSTPQVHSAARKDRSMRAAKKRDKAQAQEAAYTQRQYELHHDD